MARSRSIRISYSLELATSTSPTPGPCLKVKGEVVSSHQLRRDSSSGQCRENSSRFGLKLSWVHVFKIFGIIESSDGSVMCSLFCELLSSLYRLDPTLLQPYFRRSYYDCCSWASGNSLTNVECSRTTKKYQPYPVLLQEHMMSATTTVRP